MMTVLHRLKLEYLAKWLSRFSSGRQEDTVSWYRVRLQVPDKLVDL